MKINYKEKIEITKYFFIDVYGWVNSLFIYTFRSIKRPAVFYGYSSFWFAQKYADKRTKGWKCKWDQSGKQQGVLPIADTKLIVCSKLELEMFKKKGLISKKSKPRKAIKKAYYATII
jgi:hypothetical protein